MSWESGKREFVPLPMTRQKKRMVAVEPVTAGGACNRAVWFPGDGELAAAPSVGTAGFVRPLGFVAPGGPGVGYAGYPLWYHGLVHESYVRIWTYISGHHLPPSGPARVRVSFHSATGRYTSTTADVPVGHVLLNAKIPITNRYTYVMAQVIAMQKQLQASDPATRAMYAQKVASLACMPASMRQFQPKEKTGGPEPPQGVGDPGQPVPPHDVGIAGDPDREVTELLVEPALTGPFPSDFIVNYCRDIRIKNISQQTIPIRCIQIRINNVMVYELGSPSLGPTAQSLGPQETLNLSSSIHNYLMQQVDYLHNRNPILRCAALRIGESVRSEYDAPWEKVEGTDAFCHRSKHWCTEFDAWAIRKGTGGEIEPVDDDDNPCGNTDEMKKYFIQKRRFISPVAYGHCPAHRYEDLGTLIQPGYWVGVNQGGHSVLFCTWLDPDDRTRPGSFNPNRITNYFLTVGGNQGNSVNPGVNRISPLPDNEPNIHWAANAQPGENCQYVDGFGKTD